MAYSLANTAPNILIIPILSTTLSAEKIGDISSLLITVGILSLLSEWGSLSIGSHKLKKIEGSKSEYIGHYETVRTSIGCVLVVIYSIIATNAFEILCISIGLLSTLIYPNWVVIGLGLELKAIKIIVPTKIAQIVLTSYIAFQKGDPKIIFLTYFLTLLIGGVVGRKYIFANTDIDIRPKINYAAQRDNIFAGFYLTLGGGMAYIITSGAPFILKNLVPQKEIAIFAVSERILTCFRTLIGMILQKSFINNDAIIIPKNNGRLKYFAIMISILLIGETVIYKFYHSQQVAWCYSILWIGFSVIGVSHKHVTIGLLGSNRLKPWLYTIGSAFLAYLIMVAVVVWLGGEVTACKLAICTMFAELMIMLLGLKIKNEHI